MGEKPPTWSGPSHPLYPALLRGAKLHTGGPAFCPIRPKGSTSSPASHWLIIATLSCFWPVGNKVRTMNMQDRPPSPFHHTPSFPSQVRGPLPRIALEEWEAGVWGILVTCLPPRRLASSRKVSEEEGKARRIPGRHNIDHAVDPFHEALIGCIPSRQIRIDSTRSSQGHIYLGNTCPHPGSIAGHVCTNTHPRPQEGFEFTIQSQLTRCLSSTMTCEKGEGRRKRRGGAVVIS